MGTYWGLSAIALALYFGLSEIARAIRSLRLPTDITIKTTDNRTHYYYPTEARDDA